MARVRFIVPHPDPLIGRLISEISTKIRSIFFDYSDLVEPLSLDEAYIDVTENKKGIQSATLIAEQIRKRIKTEVGLTASAGISINKFIAKVASDYNKPDGQKTVPPEDVLGFPVFFIFFKDFFAPVLLHCLKRIRLFSKDSSAKKNPARSAGSFSNDTT